MVKIKGVEKHLKRLEDISGPQMIASVGKSLFVAGNMLQVEAQRLITSGAVSGKHHVPSKPGEPPNADTHALDRQIETVQVAPLKTEVSSNAPYAVPLEFGTSKMEERPYMRPAAKTIRPQALQLVAKAVSKVVRQR